MQTVISVCNQGNISTYMIQYLLWSITGGLIKWLCEPLTAAPDQRGLLQCPHLMILGTWPAHVSVSTPWSASACYSQVFQRRPRGCFQPGIGWARLRKLSMFRMMCARVYSGRRWICELQRLLKIILHTEY